MSSVTGSKVFPPSLSWRPRPTLDALHCDLAMLLLFLTKIFQEEIGPKSTRRAIRVRRGTPSVGGKTPGGGQEHLRKKLKFPSL